MARRKAARAGAAPDDATDRSAWVASPAASRALTGLALLVPVVAAALAAVATGRLLGRPDGTLEAIGWWAAVAGAAVTALVVAGRATRRLRPLATLFRLDLTFPGPAPSRWHVSGLRPRAADPVPADATRAEAAAHLLALVVALEIHTRTGRGHAARVAAYADLAATDLGLPAQDRVRLTWAALLHDIGALHPRPAVHDRDRPPTTHDREVLGQHVEAAKGLVEPLRPWLGEWFDGIVQHHERLDGRGYPAGLRGDEIGTAARVLTVADAYDAMTAPRSARPSMTASEAGAELLRHRGTQFDPDAVRALLHVPVDRRRAVAGPAVRLARRPVARPLVTVAARPVVPALGALTMAAVAAFATLSGLALPGQGDGETAASASPTTSVEGSSAEPRVPSPPTSAASPGGALGDNPAAGPVPPVEQEDATTTTGVGEPPPGTSSTTATTTPPGTTTTTEPPAAPPAGPPRTDPSTTTTTPNAPPVASADAESVTVLSTTTIDVLGNDRDDTGLDPSSLRITSLPGAGSASVEDGRIRYTAPLLGSTAEVGYRVCDLDGACATSVLTISIRLL